LKFQPFATPIHPIHKPSYFPHPINQIPMLSFSDIFCYVCSYFTSAPEPSNITNTSEPINDATNETQIEPTDDITQGDIYIDPNEKYGVESDIYHTGDYHIDHIDEHDTNGPDTDDPDIDDPDTDDSDDSGTDYEELDPEPEPDEPTMPRKRKGSILNTATAALDPSNFMAWDNAVDSCHRPMINYLVEKYVNGQLDESQSDPIPIPTKWTSNDQSQTAIDQID